MAAWLLNRPLNRGDSLMQIVRYKKFLEIQEELDNYDDLRILREAKEKEGDAPTISLKDAKKELHLK